MFSKISKAAVLVSTIVFSSASMSSVILSSNFDGIGNDITNIQYLENGVQVLDTSLNQIAPLSSNLPTLELFNTSDTQNNFGVNRNIHNESRWFVDFDFLVNLSNPGFNRIIGDTLSFDALILSNAGVFQPANRRLSFALDVLSNNTSIFSEELIAFGSNGPITGNITPRPVSFDLSSIELLDGGEYTFRLTAFGRGPGNNAGIDNFEFTGTQVSEVSEPSTIALFSIVLILIGLRSRIK